MNRDLLFWQITIYDLIENLKRRIAESVQQLDANYLLNVSEEDLIKSVVSENWLNVPVIKEEKIYIAYSGETKIDVSQDPNRGIFDRSEPFYLDGTTVTIAVPFEGDAFFFNVRPQTFAYNPPHAQIAGSEIHLTCETVEQNSQAIEREYKATVNSIKQFLGWLAPSLEDFNNKLEGLVREQVVRRKQKLLADQQMVTALKLPIKKREGASVTYAVPVKRRRPRIERPKAVSKTFQPEPMLAKEDYEDILAIMKNMVTVMEQSPRAFETMKEEDLRSHFLVQLNGQYEGRATGETFNFQGKTDILIREEGRNVFIAECKFWKGSKTLLETIDQLLSYLSWRDTKTAILLFNRNANFSDVLSKIGSGAPSHKCFKRDLSKSDESTFSYVFHQPNDPNREILLTVMAFDIPSGKTVRNER
jgi:hypothetical protein